MSLAGADGSAEDPAAAVPIAMNVLRFILISCSCLERSLIAIAGVRFFATPSSLSDFGATGRQRGE